MSDYNNVREALKRGMEPEMLCRLCPWDRNCITPPAMTESQVDAQLDAATKKDELAAAAAEARGERPREPVNMLMTLLAVGGRDMMASLCPVFVVRLRSSGGRELVDGVKATMQAWDDSK